MKIMEFPNGAYYHVRNSEGSKFYKELKKIFTLSRMTFFDPCCSEGQTEFPVRFNTTTGTLERFDKVTDGWIEAVSSNVMSITPTLTAHAGGGQGSAAALPSEFNNVNIVATNGDSVKLPTSSAGLVVTVKNSGVASLAVFPAVGAAIDGGTTNASVSLAPGREGTFVGTNATNWVSNVASSNSYTSTTGITAFAGGGQGSAVALTTEFNELTTVATAGDSVKLPAAIAGLKITVVNDGATAADVFPATGDTINDGGANTAVRVSPGSSVNFFAIDTTNWEASNQIMGVGDGAVATPSLSFATQPNMGFYKVSSTQLGASVSGTLVGGWNATGLFLDSITEKTSGAGITFAKPIIRKAGTAKAVNTTGAITAAELAGGLVTSTSAATVTATLPTASLLATQLGAVQGTQFEFIVDNSAGANTVTVAVNTGITVGTTALTGGDSLTISTAQVMGVFRLVFTSATAAILRRIA